VVSDCRCCIVPDVRRRFDAAFLLLLTPLLWGATFPATKIALRRLPVPTFMAWSRVLGFLAILALIPLIRRAGSGHERSFRDALGPGLILGALMFVGYLLQTEGQARTTATNTGFITGLYVVFAPIMAAALFRQKVTGSIWVAVLVSLAGLSLLSVRDLGEIRLHAGDLLVLAGAVAWAGHITAVGHYSPRFPAWTLSLAQMGAAALFHVGLATTTGIRLDETLSNEVWPLLVLTGILGSGVAFTIQILAQQTVTPGRAVVLLAGEALFAAFFAAIWIGERLSAHQWIGAALVLAAMAYSELSARRPREALVDPAIP
jgi:drug/metabolite transporter (DMT)-like permease